MSQERIMCPRCRSTNVEIHDRSELSQTSGGWPYVDQAVLTCRRCHNRWTRVALRQHYESVSSS